MTKVTIKVLRRAESELDGELQYVRSRLNQERSNRQPTVEAALAAGIAACNAFIDRHSQLLNAKFAIRNAVGAFNQDKGINSKTGQIANLEARLRALEVAMDYGSVSEYTPYGTTKTEYHPGVGSTFIDKLRSESRSLKRQIQRLKDSCNGINSSEDAAQYISEDTLKFLKSNNFID